MHSVVVPQDRRITSIVVANDRRKSHVIPFVGHIVQSSQQSVARAA
jgi:hypothetical protein